MSRILRLLTTFLDRPRVIYDRVGGRPYLSRWYLVGPRPQMDPRQEMADANLGTGRERGVVSAFLHCFHRSDDDAALHSHPWRWSFAIVLAGGYREQRWVGDQIVERVFRPGSVNVLRANDYHRVDLLGNESWSLFVAGPKTGSWYFLDPTTGLRAHWKAFIEHRRGIGPSPWIQ